MGEAHRNRATRRSGGNRPVAIPATLASLDLATVCEQIRRLCAETGATPERVIEWSCDRGIWDLDAEAAAELAAIVRDR